jgi:predicted transcriptional regulator
LRVVVALVEAESLRMDGLIEQANVGFYIAENIRKELVKMGFATAEVKRDGKTRYWEIRPTAKCREVAKHAIAIRNLSEAAASREKSRRDSD